MDPGVFVFMAIGVTLVVIVLIAAAIIGDWEMFFGTILWMILLIGFATGLVFFWRWIAFLVGVEWY